MRGAQVIVRVSLILLLLLPSVDNAQLPQQPLQTEARLDAIVAHTAGVEAGLGLTVPAGIYVRSGLVAGLGAGRHGVEGPLSLGRTSGIVPAFELGLGGGARVGVVLRRGINARR